MRFVSSESRQVLLYQDFPATFYRRGFWFPQPLRRQNYSFPVKVDTVLEIFPSSVLDIMMAARLKLFCLGYKKNGKKKHAPRNFPLFKKCLNSLIFFIEILTNLLMDLRIENCHYFTICVNLCICWKLCEIRQELFAENWERSNFFDISGSKNSPSYFNYFLKS